MIQKIKTGCIADDFTGAGDAASFLAEGGLRTILLNGIPGEDFHLPENCEAVVIALKSRTQKKEDAVRDSLAGIRWLKAHGAEKFYFKYCSTFDSTPEGNIGPVTDAILEELGEKITILCPALPANGRTVQNGILYVNGVRLEDSSMRNHPLTPMRESRISSLMKPQGKYESLEIYKETLDQPDEKVLASVKEFAQAHTHGYLVPDHIDDGDAQRIVQLFGDLRFLTGGSGILKALAALLKTEEQSAKIFSGVHGKALIVAGSCSVATRAQELCYEQSGGESIRLSDAGILSGTENPEVLWERIRNTKDSVLVYSYDTPEGLAEKRNEEGRRLAAKVEETLAGTALLAVKNGYRRIIAAGGETSGAVIQALGYHAFWIGDSIAPGVPVLVPLEDPDIRIVLKSGNFGQEDFFLRALRITGEVNE